MNLYIKIVDGKPVDHPIQEDNFIQAFPGVDLENLPPEFARFSRVAVPQGARIYEINDSTYDWDNGIVKDVHVIRPMTPEEKESLQNQAKEFWAQQGLASWVFNEETCAFDPPIPYPQDGHHYIWDEPTTSWIVNE
jgi:hypothetical protein